MTSEQQGLGKLGDPPPTCPGGPDLEVQVQDVVLMEVVHALADLLGEQDHVQLGQVVPLVCDPVEELTPIHTAKVKGEAGAGLSKALRELSTLGSGSQNRPTQVSPRLPLSGVSWGPLLWPIPSSECR